MTEPRDDFDKRLSADLREWTDALDRPHAWADDARMVAAGGTRGGKALQPVLGGLAVAAAVVVAVLITGLRPQGDPDPSPISLPASDASAASQAASVTPAGKDLRLGSIAWWDQLSIGYGIAPEMQSPSQAVQPLGFRQVRIGTLEGRVTAVLAVHWDWGHSYVSGPMEGRVVVTDDHGTISTVRLVEAASGRITEVLRSTDLITAAALSPNLRLLYYAKLSRDTMTGGTLWLRDLESGDEVQIDEAPPQFGSGEVDVWQLAVSPDAIGSVVAQFCFGEVSCTTHVMDSGGDMPLVPNTVRVTEAIGWVQGFGDREMYGYTPGERDLVTLDLDTMEVRLGAPLPAQETARVGDFGVELPTGWRAIWPQISGESAGHEDSPWGPVELINMETRETMTATALFADWGDECGPLRPAELPSGRPYSGSVRWYEDGVGYMRFGSGTDLVIERFQPNMPTAPIGSLAATTVRGVEARVDLVDDAVIAGAPIPWVMWRQDKCLYWLILPGLTIDEAVEYGPRF